MIRDTFKTIAAALGLLVALVIAAIGAGSIVGWFVTGVCMTAPAGWCI